MPESGTETAPRGGPRTPEGKARSARNALRHGLRAGRFALLPHEDPASFAELVEGLRRAHAPADAVELLYVDAIAVAIWRELRADRLEGEAMADLPPADEGRGFGSDLTEHPARASLATLVRYRAAAQAEHRRALRLLEEHRRLRTAAAARAGVPGRVAGTVRAPADPPAPAEPAAPAFPAPEPPSAEPLPPEPLRVPPRARARAARALRERIRAYVAARSDAAPDPAATAAPAAEAAPADAVAEARALLGDWLARTPPAPDPLSALRVA